MSGYLSSLPTEGFSKLQNEVESRSQATKERGRQWLGHREAYSELKDRLQEMDGKMQYDVMVPLTSKAMMPGKVVHTNEILVLLGDNWFVETSAKEAAKIAGRRLEECDKMLRGLEEELRLNEGWRQQARRIEGEKEEGAVDIREEYDEEEDRRWREKHREAVKREKKEKGDVGEEKEEKMSDSELWSRLEELEVREALEKEWEEEEDESDEESESSEGEDEDSCDEEVVKDSEDKEEKEEIVEKKKQFKRRVSWGNLEKPVVDEGLEIRFSHSVTPNPTPDHAPVSKEGVWPPRTPGDVCLSDKKPSKSILKSEPSKSILKSSSSSDLPPSGDSLIPSSLSRSQSRDFPPGFQPQTDYFSQLRKSPKSETTNLDFEEERGKIVDYVPAIADVVVEKNVGQGGSDKVDKEPKKVSRFKAARANKDI